MKTLETTVSEQPKWQCNACKKIYDTEAEAAGCCCEMHSHARSKVSLTDDPFFIEAFTDPMTGEPYAIPENLKRLSARICRSYGIRGSCDPMYIANIIAFELGLGDGKSNFKSI